MGAMARVAGLARLGGWRAYLSGMEDRDARPLSRATAQARRRWTVSSRRRPRKAARTPRWRGVCALHPLALHSSWAPPVGLDVGARAAVRERRWFTHGRCAVVGCAADAEAVGEARRTAQCLSAASRPFKVQRRTRRHRCTIGSHIGRRHSTWHRRRTGHTLQIRSLHRFRAHW